MSKLCAYHNTLGVSQHNSLLKEFLKVFVFLVQSRVSSTLPSSFSPQGGGMSKGFTQATVALNVLERVSHLSGYWNGRKGVQD
jgi:hypothetical protein